MVFDVQCSLNHLYFFFLFLFLFFFTQGNVPLLSLPASTGLLLSEVTSSLKQRLKTPTTETSEVMYGHSNRISSTDLEVTT